MQTYRPVGPNGGFQLDPGDRLPDSFVLEPVTEKRFGTHISRISRVIAIVPVEKPVDLEDTTENLISLSQGFDSAKGSAEL